MRQILFYMKGYYIAFILLGQQGGNDPVLSFTNLTKKEKPSKLIF